MAFDATDYALALWCAPHRARAKLRIIFALDARLQMMMPRVREPILGQIKLAWWREALIALDSGDQPAEPQLQAVAGILGGGLTGTLLSTLATDEDRFAALGESISQVTGGDMRAHRLLIMMDADDRRRTAAHQPLASPARRTLWALRLRLIGR